MWWWDYSKPDCNLCKINRILRKANPLKYIGFCCKNSASNSEFYIESRHILRFIMPYRDTLRINWCANVFQEKFIRKSVTQIFEWTKTHHEYICERILFFFLIPNRLCPFKISCYTLANLKFGNKVLKSKIKRIFVWHTLYSNQKLLLIYILKSSRCFTLP